MLIKISAKKGKHPSLIKPQVLIWACCFLKYIEGHLITNHQKRFPNLKSKMDTKNHEKAILILQWVNFCFQNTWQSKDCIFL